jgi:hypothetical protein
MSAAPQFLTDDDGNRIAVVIDLATYRQMIEDLEDLEDIRAADAAREDDPEGLPFKEAFSEIERERAARHDASS